MASPQRQFHLGTRSLMARLRTPLSARGFDFLELAMAVYAADRTQRRGANGADGLCRNMAVAVAVRDPAYWNSPTINALVVTALEMVSSDAWSVEFVRRTEPTEIQRSLFDDFEKYDAVALYSAGLDSASGLAAKVQSNDGCRRITATALHQSGLRRLVRHQLDVIGESASQRVPSVFLKTQLKRATRLDQQERTQRCRGFLFAALGAVVAASVDADVVEVYENGVGSLNVPLMAGMAVGGRTTKNAHPAFLKLMSEIGSQIADRRIEFVLPFLNYTKAELVGVAGRMDRFNDIANATVSCVHFPLHSNKKQCGVCLGCLGRRQALRLAGIPETQGIYQFDFFGDRSEFDRIPDQWLGYLKATLHDVNRPEFDSAQRLPQHAIAHIYGTGIAGVGEPIDQWIQLLQRHRSEWQSLADDARQCGLKWGNWFRMNDIAKESAA